MPKIRVGVIGLGIISHAHISGIMASKDAELVAVSDIREDMLKAAGEKYKIETSCCFKNYVDLISCPDVDAVTICTPNNIHYEVVKQAIACKKPFALEKPVTVKSKEAEELCNLANQQGVPNMICFSYRYKAAARYARWLIQNGYLGKIYHVYGQYLQSWAISKDLPRIWRFSKKESGSGALGDLGSHIIDLTRFVVGEFNSVCGQTGTFIRQRKIPGSDQLGEVDVDDYCNIMAEIEGGVSGTFEITRFAFGRGNYQRFEVYGDKGGLVYSLDNDDVIEVCIGDIFGKAMQYTSIPIPEEFKKDQMQSFLDIILGRGDGLSATIDDGLINQRLLDAVLESAERKSWMSV